MTHVTLLLGLAFAMANASADAYDLRRCFACKATCDDTAHRDDETCCRDARGTQTADFCISKRPQDYVACIKDLASTRQTCRTACDHGICAK